MTQENEKRRCEPALERVTIEVGGVCIGLAQLKETFEVMCRTNTTPRELGCSRIMQELEKYNYIPESARNEYFEAICREWQEYCKRRRK